MLTDIASVLSNAHVEFKQAPHARVRRGWVGVDCPKCSPGHRKFRLGFELSSGRAHCWVCGTLPPAKTLAQVLRIHTGKAAELLQNAVKGFLPAAAKEESSGVLIYPKGVEELGPAHEHYIKSRGLDIGEIRRLWKVRGIGLAARLKWSLFIPIMNEYGREVSWTTRSIGKENDRRYYSASPEEEEVPHKSVLYGAHLARHTIAIQEGPIDAWTIGPGGVSTFGVGFSQAQLSTMVQYPVRIVCSDNEPAAQARAERLCNDLSVMPGIVENVVFETGKDANASNPLEIQEFRKRFFPELYCEQTA